MLVEADRQTDGRADSFLIARPRMHSMQRGKNGIAGDAQKLAEVTCRDSVSCGPPTTVMCPCANRSHLRNETPPT